MISGCHDFYDYTEKLWARVLDLFIIYDDFFFLSNFQVFNICHSERCYVRKIMGLKTCILIHYVGVISDRMVVMIHLVSC